jgi:ATP-dependent Clp protease ATP-binding subunit ClpA
MSEYRERHSVSRLIGSPPGYVGYEQGGQLTEAVRRRPYSVILLDEIEKAHPEVFNVLLQLLDDGRLTDGQGRVVDFKNTIVIMTSNLGSDKILEMTQQGQEYQQVQDEVLRIMPQNFKPEFLNRIDDMIVFQSLQPEQVEEIIDLQVEEINQKLVEKEIQIRVSEEAKHYLRERGYDPIYGARPLKRLMSREIENKLAEEMLAGTIEGGQMVEIDSGEQGLEVRPQTATES